MIEIKQRDLILESKDFNGSAFGENLLPRFRRVNQHPSGVRPAKLVAFPRSPTTWKLTAQLDLFGWSVCQLYAGK